MTENAVEARVWIDDILLQDLGITVLLNSEDPALPAMRNFNVTIPGKHGALDLGAYFEPRQFELNCVFARQSYTELKRSILELNTLLVDENGHPKTVKLRFGDDEHKWFIVRLTDGIPIERVAERGFYTIVLTAYDPFAYAPATYYDPDVVGDYAESVHKWEFGGEKRGVNLIPNTSGIHKNTNTLIRNPSFNGQVGGRNLLLGTSSEIKQGIDFKTWNSDMYVVSDNVVSEIKEGGKFTLSAEFVETYSNDSSRFGLILQLFANGSMHSQYFDYGTFLNTGETGYSIYTLDLPNVSSNESIDEVRVYIRSNNDIGTGENGKRVKYRNLKLEKGDQKTPWSPAPEDSGWQFSQTIEGDFYGDGETNDKLVWINSMPYKESWWYFAGERLLKRDKPELIKVRSRGAIYLKEGINTINVSDENNMLDTVDMTYQHGTVKLSRGDNIIDSPQLEYSKYGADLEYTNQVYSPFLNTRQYVGVFNYSHYATPFNFVIEGYCKNPKIINQTTGRYISFNLTVQNDERLYVDSRRLATWKIKIKDDQYEYLTPHKIMRDYEAWDRINAYNESEGDFVMLSSGENHWRFESDVAPDAKIYLDWEHRFL